MLPFDCALSSCCASLRILVVLCQMTVAQCLHAHYKFVLQSHSSILARLSFTNSQLAETDIAQRDQNDLQLGALYNFNIANMRREGCMLSCFTIGMAMPSSSLLKLSK